MFFKFCEDRVNTVNSAAATALAPILVKFKNDSQQMRAIIKIVKNNFRYGDVATFKRRQLFVIMCEHIMNQAPEIFQEYFINDFLSLVQDRVVNVRISVARTLRNHFKTIIGAFVSDTLVNHAIRVLRHDKDSEVVSFVTEIQSLQDFDDASSQASNASANTEMSTEVWMEALSKSHRNSSSTDGETTQMEEEIIKSSGIDLIRAAEKKAEAMAKMKPEVVKIGALKNIEKREKEDGNEEALSQELSQLSEEEQAALTQQLENEDPFSDSLEAQPENTNSTEESQESKE